MPEAQQTQGDGVGDGGGDDEPNVPLPRDLSEHIPLIVTTNICVTTFLCRCNNKYLDITTNIWILQLCVEIILLQLINVVTVFVTTNSLKVVRMEYATVTSYNGDCYEF